MEDKNIFRKKILRFAAISAGIIALEAAAIVFLLGRISSRADEVTAKRTLLLSFQEEVAGFDVLERDYQRILPFIGTISATLPDAENLFRVVEALQNAALALGSSMTLTLQSQFPLAADISGVNYVPFSATLDGNYELVRRYIQGLENIPVFVAVEAVSLSSPSSIFAGGNISLSGKIYTR